MGNKLEQVKELVKPDYDTLDCWVHSWSHIEGVFNNTQKLANLESVNPLTCGIAAYCHDLGRIEEEKRKQKGEPFFPHALFSIEPTIEVLRKVGISGVDFAEIVEAVVVHSYWTYEGKNNTARILQDADKIIAFGPYGVLGAIKYFGGKDYINPSDILDNRNNSEKIQEFCNYSLSQLKGENLEKIINGFDFVIEWWDKIHTESARRIAKDDFEYYKKIRENLIKKLS
ncbi:MAG: HD domain-containing protein [Nanoarchaeota archaeon]|nr:HD domain-containing protein [Nanoarchaeota archaeon]MBU1028264.1 HD domain-containing protein [Nanoarchaeota archaeon]